MTAREETLTVMGRILRTGESPNFWVVKRQAPDRKFQTRREPSPPVESMTGTLTDEDDKCTAKMIQHLLPKGLYSLIGRFLQKNNKKASLWSFGLQGKDKTC